MLCDHLGLHGGRSSQSNSSFNDNFPHEYHNNNHLHNPYLALNNAEATPVEQPRYGVNGPVS